jgi:hypothetical protein
VLVRKIRSQPILDQKRDIATRHSWLQDRVDVFQKQAESMLHAVSNNLDNSWGNDFTSETYTGAEFDGVGKEEDNDGLDLAANEHYKRHPTDGCIDAECIPLYLPSNIG